jgi:energy-coupling factor transporter ATP-binding protein EcfA2
VYAARGTDEPIGNLDSGNSAGILDLRARLRAEHDMTIILASRDPQIAARAERLIRLRDGAVVDDIQLTGDRPVEAIIRRVGQLGRRTPIVTNADHPGLRQPRAHPMFVRS